MSSLIRRQGTPLRTGSRPGTEDLYRSIVELCPDATYKRDLEKDRYDYVSPVIEEITGLTAAEFSSLSLAGVLARIHPDDVNVVTRSIEDAASAQRGFVEYRFEKKHGGYRWLSDHFVVIRDEQGRRRYLLGAIRDITERKRIEEALRQSEEQYRTFFELGLVGMGQAEPRTGRLIRVNDRFCEMTGYTRHELLSKTVRDLTHPEDREADREKFERMLRGETDEYRAEKRYVRKDGRVIWVLATARAIRDTGGKPLRTAGIVIDITERKRMEQELRSSRDELELHAQERTEALRRQTLLAEHERDRLMTLIDSMNEGVWFTHVDGRIVLVNSVAKAQAAEVGIDPDALLQRRSSAFLSQVDMFAPDGTPLHMEQLRRVFQGEPFSGLEIALRNRTTGEVFYRRMSANPIFNGEKRIEGAITVVQDITAAKRAEKERARLEEQLRQSLKMEAVGTLAGGIAHDFNNMLAVVLGNAELALDDMKGDDGPRRNIEQIIKASKRARDLVRQILTFSRKSAQEKKPLRLTDLAKDTFRLLRGVLPSTVRMELDVKTGSDTVVGDASQIQQIVMNLAANGAYAMREKGGALTIGVSGLTLREGDPMPSPEMEPGRYVRLTVRDTGTGMTEEVRRRLFEPFFTTKQPDEGTGMGLAVVFGIVKSHGGAITVESSPGEGSLFSVFLPYADIETRDEKEKEGALPGGNERILLVDDEPLIVEMAAQMLKRLGYTVTTARNGSEALEVFLAGPHRFDLVITDQTMPDLTGIALAKRLLEIRGDLPVILFTGYSETVSAERARAEGVREFIMKPMAKREVAEAIRRVLDK